MVPEPTYRLLAEGTAPLNPSNGNLISAQAGIITPVPSLIPLLQGRSESVLVEAKLRSVPNTDAILNVRIAPRLNLPLYLMWFYATLVDLAEFSDK